MVMDGLCPATIGWAPCRTNRKNGAQHLSLLVFGNRRNVEAFMLTPSRSGGHEHPEAPEWFPKTPTEATQTLTNATGSFKVLWDKERNLLHASDSGSGFRPGAPEPAQPVVQNTPSGRLPTTPPPKP